MAQTPFQTFARALIGVAGIASLSLVLHGAGQLQRPSLTVDDALFAASPLLSRPTDHSVTLRAISRRPVDIYAEWGLHPGQYSGASVPVRAAAGVPFDLRLDALRADTAYVYRLRWREVGAPVGSGDNGFAVGEEHRFQTQRRPGSTFSFVIQADPHLDDNSSQAVYAQTLGNMLADEPDFLVDLGDTSMVDKCTVAEDTLCGGAATSFDEVLTRNALMRSYFDLIGHSVPLFMALGNHDGESGTTTAGAQALSTWSLAARKHFYANPEPDDFYRGNTTLSPDQGFRQNYYAFEWGDALFVVLDPYTYTVRKPRRGVDRDGWTWTLGETQYRWLVETLAGSEARYKFVFSHHLLGGNGSEARGGAAFGSFFEWGGQDLDGTWAFDRERPGWGRPIRQLFSDYRVTAWFHGHDHFYAREQLDGTIYQEVPQPSLDRYDMPNPAAGYGYLGAMGENQFASSGHLRVTVSPTAVQVDYVRSVAPGDEVGTRRNRAILQSYTIR